MPVSKINFFADGVNYTLKSKKTIREWLANSAKTEGYIIKELSYIFCSDDALLEINQAFLNHDTLTDIITFDNSEKKNEIIGEIYISIERIQENAEKYKTETSQELRRVMIHGVMHLCGYKDKSTTDKSIMKNKEDEYLGTISLYKVQ